MDVNSVVPETEKKSVRYDFSESEVNAMARDMSHTMAAQKRVAEDKKTAVSQFNFREAELEAKLNRLSGLIGDGWELRDIEHLIKYNTPVIGQKTLVRSDNGHQHVERMEEWEHNLFTANMGENITGAINGAGKVVDFAKPVFPGSDETEIEPPSGKGKKKLKKDPKQKGKKTDMAPPDKLIEQNEQMAADRELTEEELQDLHTDQE